MDANAPKLWDEIWTREGIESWRGKALAGVYERIVELVPEGSPVVDFGGGVGILGVRLRDDLGCGVHVLDHSPEACRQARTAGLEAICFNLDDIGVPSRPYINVSLIMESVADARNPGLFSAGAMIGNSRFLEKVTPVPVPPLPSSP